MALLQDTAAAKAILPSLPSTRIALWRRAVTEGIPNSSIQPQPTAVNGFKTDF